MQISFHHTHAYPGCLATVIDLAPASKPEGDALAEFSDGSSVSARYALAEPGALVVHVAAYETARRTRIAAKSWKLRRMDDGRWKVVARVIDQPSPATPG